jgi:hypothetical protein
MEKCGYRSVIAYSAWHSFCSREVNLTMRCLLLVHRQLQLAHDLAQVVQRRFGVAPPAQDHEVVGIGDQASAETLLKAEPLGEELGVRAGLGETAVVEHGEPVGMPETALALAPVLTVCRWAQAIFAA